MWRIWHGAKRPPTLRPGQTTRAVSPPVGCQKPHPQSPIIIIITQLKSWYSFYRPTEGRRLSRPTHCSNGVQPVPKAVYRIVVFTGRQHSRLRKPCVNYDWDVRPSVCLSVKRWHWVKTTQARITKSSPTDSPRTLDFGIKNSSRNSKGFTPSEGVKWEWGRKNSQFSANKSPHLRNGAR